MVQIENRMGQLRCGATILGVIRLILFLALMTASRPAGATQTQPHGGKETTPGVVCASLFGLHGHENPSPTDLQNCKKRGTW